MNYDTVYYWRVDTHSSGITKGEVWNFRTVAAPPPPPLPGQAANPNPPDAAQDVALNETLSWDSADNATGYSVYFGIVSPPPFLVNQSETFYDPGAHSNETTYYWRVDAYNDYGLTAGNIWTFATAATPPIEDKLEWAKGIYGGQVTASDVAAFADGSIVVTGYYSETNATVCAGHDNEIVLPEPDCPEMFLAKVDSTGAPVWATRTVTIGITPLTIARAVDTYPDGSVVAVGWMEIGGLGGTITFGANEDNETSFSTGAGQYDGFIAKYNTDGKLYWVRRISGSNSIDVRGVLALPDGSCIATGYFVNDATFGPFANASNTVLYSSSLDREDCFIARYDPNGTLIWARSAGGEGYDYAEGIDGWADGSAIITGRFGEWGSFDATFGMGDDNETLLSPIGQGDIFTAKYNPDGTICWAKNAGGSHDLRPSGSDVAVLDDGYSLVTGSFQDNATFGKGEVNEITLYSAGRSDIFIAKYGPDGSLAWVTQAGGAEGDGARSIDVISDGSILLTGGFSIDAVFGAGGLNATTLQATAGPIYKSDIFVARYNSDGTLNWARSAGGAGGEYGKGISALSDGSFFVVGLYGSSNYSAVFGSGEANETTLEPNNGSNYGVFIARYRP